MLKKMAGKPTETMGLRHCGLSILNNYSVIGSIGLKKYLNSTLPVG